MEYTVRSTRTRKSSRLRRAADGSVIFILCLLILLFIFKVMLEPVRVTAPQVSELEEGDLVLVDRVSKYIAEYAVGDIVRADTGDGLAEYRLAAKGPAVYTVRGGSAYLNGALLDESAYSDGWQADTEFELRIPEGSVLLLPDARQGIEGAPDAVPYNDIIGEVRVRVSPIRRFALFF